MDKSLGGQHMNGTTSLNVQEVWEEALAVIRGRIGALYKDNKP